MLNFITSRPLLKGILIGVGASAAAFYLYKRHEDKVDSFLRDQGFDVGCGCNGELDELSIEELMHVKEKVEDLIAEKEMCEQSFVVEEEAAE